MKQTTSSHSQIVTTQDKALEAAQRGQDIASGLDALSEIEQFKGNDEQKPEDQKLG